MMRMCRAVVVAVALVAVAAPAAASDVQARAKYQLGRDAFARAQFRRALELFTTAEVLAESPSLAAEIAVHRGYCEALRRPEDALRSFVRALRRDASTRAEGANDKAKALFECARTLVEAGLGDREIAKRQQASGGACAEPLPAVAAVPPPGDPVERPGAAPGAAALGPAAPAKAAPVAAAPAVGPAPSVGPVPAVSPAPSVRPVPSASPAPAAPEPRLADPPPSLVTTVDASDGLGWPFWVAASGAVVAGGVGVGLGASTLGDGDLGPAQDRATVANVALVVAGVSAGLAVLSVVMR